MALFIVWLPEIDINCLWILLIWKCQAVLSTDWHNFCLGQSLWRLLQNIDKPLHSLLELTWFLSKGSDVRRKHLHHENSNILFFFVAVIHESKLTILCASKRVLRDIRRKKRRERGFPSWTHKACSSVAYIYILQTYCTTAIVIFLLWAADSVHVRFVGHNFIVSHRLHFVIVDLNAKFYS
jgi:hypothetical protein